MDAATLMTTSRDLTGTDTFNMPDPKLITYVNFVRHDIEARIVSFINEHIFYGALTIDTVANQEKYSLPTATSWWTVTSLWTPGTIELRKLLSIGIKYATTDAKYIKCQETNQSVAYEFIDTYKTYQDATNPVFLIQDNAIYVYPAPTAIVTAGIKIEAIRKLFDITTSATEAQIGIPWEYHDTLVLWIKKWIYDFRWLVNKKQEAEAEYERSMNLMLRKLTDFVAMPMERAIYIPKTFMK